MNTLPTVFARTLLLVGIAAPLVLSLPIPSVPTVSAAPATVEHHHHHHRHLHEDKDKDRNKDKKPPKPPTPAPTPTKTPTPPPPPTPSPTATPSPTPSPTPVPVTAFVTTDGVHFIQNGRILQLSGYTFYPATAGGTAAWRSPSAFSAFITSTIALGDQAGQRLLRPTDYWDSTASGQVYNDPVIWGNMDALVALAAQHHDYVLMDLSAYKWLLQSQGKDPYNATNWTTFLQFVGARYRTNTTVMGYSIVGEPPFPTTQAAADAMVSYYAQLTDTLYAADPNHLISAGGFNNMEYGVGNWWQRIYALPHNDIAAFKTYSQNDLNLMPTVAAYAHSIHKPLMDEEFGAPQSIGDTVWTGVVWNHFSGSRSQFYTDVYREGDSLGVSSFIFWNLAPLLGSTHYDVSPLTPGVWAVMTAHATTGQP